MLASLPIKDTAVPNESVGGDCTGRRKSPLHNRSVPLCKGAILISLSTANPFECRWVWCYEVFRYMELDLFVSRGSMLNLACGGLCLRLRLVAMQRRM